MTFARKYVTVYNNISWPDFLFIWQVCEVLGFDTARVSPICVLCRRCSLLLSQTWRRVSGYRVSLTPWLLGLIPTNFQKLPILQTTKNRHIICQCWLPWSRRGLSCHCRALAMGLAVASPSWKIAALSPTYIGRCRFCLLDEQMQLHYTQLSQFRNSV